MAGKIAVPLQDCCEVKRLRCLRPDQPGAIDGRLYCPGLDPFQGIDDRQNRQRCRAVIKDLQ